MLGSKASDPMMPSDFCLFHTPEIRKRFEFRSFSCGKWLLSHVWRATKSCFITQAWNTWPFDPGIIWCWGQKHLTPWCLRISACFTLPKSEKHSKSAHFPVENSCFLMFGGSKSHAFSCRRETHDLLTLASYYKILYMISVVIHNIFTDIHKNFSRKTAFGMI